LNAEDWRQDLRPDPGTLQRAAFPIKAGVRVDSHMQSGATITPFYDSMVAKLIVHAADREGAVTGMAEALANSELKGVKNTIGLHQALMMHPDFRAGGISTRWFPGVFDTLLSGSL